MMTEQNPQAAAHWRDAARPAPGYHGPTPDGGAGMPPDAMGQQGRLPTRKRPPRVRTRRHNFFLDMPFAFRLALSFILAALIAAGASAGSYFQRAQTLANEAGFYEQLLSANTSLTTASNLMQLMDTKVHQTLVDASVPKPSQESLNGDQSAIEGLIDRNGTTLADYVAQSPVDLHADEVSQLTTAGHGSQVIQQRVLINSVVRAWSVYKGAVSRSLEQIIGSQVVKQDIPGAATSIHSQEEPTAADALSAVRSLIQFNGRIARSVHDFAEVEQANQLTTVIAAAGVAMVAIALVGWLLSESVVRRLWTLRRVVGAVDKGDLAARVTVVGHDEIGRVGASVNRMLDTIAGLLDVSQRQRDALLHAAERLFADVRVAGAGDLQARAAVGGDPIGMLANAFNFTVGRFRRFVGRTQSTVDQLDVLARQQYERAESFLYTVHQTTGNLGGQSIPSNFSRGSYASQAEPVAIPNEVGRARELVRMIAQEGSSGHARTAFDAAEQAYLSAGRLSQLALSLQSQPHSEYSGHLIQGQLDELRSLGNLLVRMGQAAQALQQGSMGRLSELDQTLDRLSTLRPPSMPSAPSAPSMAGDAGSPIAAIRGQEVARMSLLYAQDVATQARQVITLMQDMRMSLSNFRLEGGAPQGTMLYAPGGGDQRDQAAEWFDQQGSQQR